MSDANEHARVVLSTIIPDRTDLLEVALQKIEPEWIPDAVLRGVFLCLKSYYEAAGGVLHHAAMSDMLEGKLDAGKYALYSETFLMLHEASSKEEHFRWSLGELKELAAHRATGDALMEAVAIYRDGYEDAGGDWLQGHQAARIKLLERLADIDKSLNRQSAPEGDMRAQGDAMRSDYAKREKMNSAGIGGGILFGIENLDAKVGGLQRGDVCLVVGGTSTGKTAMMVQLAWSAAVQQGKNVVFLTTETVHEVVRRRMLARHSRLPRLDIPEGLNSRDLRAGTLTVPEKLKLEEVICDFTSSPNYGRMQITQVPRGASLTSIETMLNKYQREFDVDLVIIDYLRLLRSDKKRQTDREEINSIMVETKQLATTFRDGYGVPIVSPWQVSRAQQEIAMKAQYYTTAALAESSEASNTADVIVALLAPGESESRYAELKAQALKNRDGETASGLLVDVDYATATFSSKGIGGSFGRPDNSAGPDTFSGLL